jgi:hypothetical protein
MTEKDAVYGFGQLVCLEQLGGVCFADVIFLPWTSFVARERQRWYKPSAP